MVSPWQGGFPGTGMDPADHGPCNNLMHIPLPKGTASAAYLDALRTRALPFLLGGGGGGSPAAATPPSLLLVCAGYDALAADPLATMTLTPADFYASAKMITAEFGFPPSRIALGLEGGYDLSHVEGMPAALVQTCKALVEQER